MTGKIEKGIHPVQRYLITGASRGIGRAIALRLAASNRRLLLNGRNEEALEETCRLVKEKGGDAACLIYDLRDPDQVLDLVEQVGDQPLDLLVNNAGLAGAKPLEELTLDEWQNMLAVNVTAPFILTQKLLPLMPPGASIIRSEE